MRQQTLHRYFPTVRPRRSAAYPVLWAGLPRLPPSVRTLIYRHAGLVSFARVQEYDDDDDDDDEDHRHGRVLLNPGNLADGWCKYADPVRANEASRSPIEHRKDDRPVLELCCIHCGNVEIADYYKTRHCPGPCCFSCHLDEIENGNETSYYYDSFPRQLFSVCRLLYEETTLLFYSEMGFEIVRTAPGGFMALKRLGPLAVSSLRDLTIRLNVCFCPDGEACSRTDHRLDGCYSLCRIGGHDEPLGKRPGSRDDRSAWLDLRDLCAHLGRHLPPNQLKLAFVCEVKDHELATKFTDALRQLPILRSCTISLSRIYDPRLRKLAQQTQLRLTNPAHDISKPFRFRDLPREIQLEVLRHSGLIAPFHVQFDLRTNQPAREVECIYKCDVTKFRSTPVMCCCKYGAHSSSSWICSHWHLPNALFLVDRRMARDAETIMYSDNYWVVRNLMQGLLPTNGSARMRAIFSRFLSTVRQVQIWIPYQLPKPGPGRKSFLADLGRLFKESTTEKLDLTLALPHPDCQERAFQRHPLAPSSTLVEFSPEYIEQDRMAWSIIAGLRGRRLRKFTVGIDRAHYEFPADGLSGPRVSECSHVPYLDAKEMWLEDRVATTVPRLHQERRGSARIHKLHVGGEYEEGHDCPICGTLAHCPESLYFGNIGHLHFYHV